MRIKSIRKKKLRRVELKKKCNSKNYPNPERITIKRLGTIFDKIKILIGMKLKQKNNSTNYLKKTRTKSKGNK
jgi:hypothetical protein